MRFENSQEALFLAENKNRFVGKILLDNNESLCYIASSSHLKHFIDLKDRKILLLPIESKKATIKYSLFAVEIEDTYIITNTNVSNQIIRNEIHSKYFDFLGARSTFLNEHNLGNYKCDIFIPETKTVIEIKSLISLNDIEVFPNVYSKRFEKQLSRIEQLLTEQFKVYLFIISYGPTSEISLNRNIQTWNLLNNCIKKGLIIKAFNCYLANDKIPKIEYSKSINLNI